MKITDTESGTSLDFAKMPSWDTFLDCPILAVMDTHLRAQDISKLLFVIHV